MTDITPDLEAGALLSIATETGVLARETEIVERTAQLQRAGVPERYALAATADRNALERTEAIAVAEAWAKRQAGTLVLSGLHSRGKTVAAVRYAVISGAQWLYAPCLGDVPFAQLRDELDRLVGVQHLVIDDLGRQGSTGPVAVERLMRLFADRHAHMRHTVVTTNMSQSDFASVYEGVKSPGESPVLARIREDGRWLDCNGRDYRERPVNIAKARVDRARRFLALVELAKRVELGNEPATSLAELAEQLQVTQQQVRERVAACMAARLRTHALLEGLLGRMRSSEARA